MNRLLWVLSVLLVAACGVDAPAVDEASIRDAVSARIDGYVQAIRDGDLNYIREFWADDPDFAMAGDGTLSVGYDAWIQSVEELTANTDSVAFVEIVGEPAVAVLGPDAASYAMEYRWRFVMRDGSTLSAEGSWMYVFRRIDGQWRAIHSAGSHIYS